jgi:OOP family OmpA-OmpF porin
VTRSFLLAFAAICGATAIVSSSSRAEAQSKKEFSTVRFYPAVGPGNYIAVEGATVKGRAAPTFGVYFDYAADTLVIDKPCDGIRNLDRCTNKKTDFVASTGMAHILGAFSLHDRVQLSIGIPLGFTDASLFTAKVKTSDGSSPNLEISPSQGFALADMRVAAKVRIWGDDSSPFAISASAFTTLPTAMITSNGDCRATGQCSFTGERGANVGANAIAEYRIANFRVAANVGAAYRPHRRFLTAQTGTEIGYGVGARYDITPLVHVRAEAQGAVGVVAKDYPIEGRGAFSFGRDFIGMIGAGGGYGEVGAPTYRIFAGAQYTPVHRDLDRDGLDDDRDGCPSEAEDRDGFMDQDGCPEPDNDGDGVFDAKDACDNEREDVDDFADDDGCPELDNDGDGVQDGYDSCEGLKEDRDGDKDDDGCPDFDTDRDGIRDDLDACPNAAEDTDGLADEDGCPEDDFDGDGLKDTEDGCSDQPESWNGIMDSDGCPEDDADQDSVPDQVDACEGQAETLNGLKDADGCPDSVAVFSVQGQKLSPLGALNFEGERLTNEKVLVTALADFIKRNHKRGNLRVVLTAPESPMAVARAAAFAKALEKRSTRTVTSANVPGTPQRLEVELLPPGLSKLPGSPEPAAATAPASGAAIPAAHQPPKVPAAAPGAPAPAPGTPAAAPAPGAPASTPSAPAAVKPPAAAQPAPDKLGK